MVIFIVVKEICRIDVETERHCSCNNVPFAEKNKQKRKKKEKESSLSQGFRKSPAGFQPGSRLERIQSRDVRQFELSSNQG